MGRGKHPLGIQKGSVQIGKASAKILFLPWCDSESQRRRGHTRRPSEHIIHKYLYNV